MSERKLGVFHGLEKDVVGRTLFKEDKLLIVFYNGKKNSKCFEFQFEHTVTTKAKSITKQSNHLWLAFSLTCLISR